jgi:hypothetical protein
VTEYHVEYHIEVDAESPEEAARKVAAILAGGGAGRGVYHVAENHLRDQVEEIDLSLTECNGCKRPAAEVEDGELGYGADGDLCYECFMRYTGHATCPQCDEWVDASEIDTWHTTNGPVRMCSGCVHNARRSGGLD